MIVEEKVSSLFEGGKGGGGDRGAFEEWEEIRWANESYVCGCGFRCDSAGIIVWNFAQSGLCSLENSSGPLCAAICKQ